MPIAVDWPFVLTYFDVMLKQLDQSLLPIFDHNPFAVLAVSPQDNRQRIVEAAEDRSLFMDPRQCMEARANLINPRKRLSAETGWLPGVSSDQVERLLGMVVEEPCNALSQKLPSLAKLNLLAAAIITASKVVDFEEDQRFLGDWISEMSDLLENLDIKEIQETVNRDRLIAGFSQIQDLYLIRDALETRRRAIGEKIQSVLDTLSPDIIVSTVTDIVKRNGSEENRRTPILIGDIVDIYEMETRVFSRQEAESISGLVDHIKERVLYSQEEIDLDIAHLSQVIRKWGEVVLPARLNRQARGMSHELSDRVSFEIRELAVFLFNHYGLDEQARRLTTVLHEVFSGSPDIIDQLAGDMKLLEQLLAEREMALEEKRLRYEALGDRIRYEVEIGLIAKGKLKISPEGLQWKGRVWDLDAINRVRWGALRLSIVNASLRTQYVIMFGDQENLERIVMGNKGIYEEFIEKLWFAVCTRIMSEMLTELSEGRKLHFRNTVIDDYGVQLVNTKVLTSGEPLYAIWSDISLSNDNGQFSISLSTNSSVRAVLPYIEIDNVNLIEAIIRKALDKNCVKLSQIVDNSSN